ncbi:MAG: LysM peptidoglycan-binding domain-containing protein [Candidatus Omnitrophica bacterium]|nr:LysM peptidoglycan-binding domain-containing protein [Candidatus Omnitrophota bacterium]
MKTMFVAGLVALFFTNIAIANQIIQRHTVKKGETLSSLAAKYNVSVEQIKKWNGISRNTIYPGQTIIVGKYQTKEKNVYTVKKGDTLSSISEKTGVSAEKIKNYNSLSSNKLYPGQTLALTKIETKKSGVTNDGIHERIANSAYYVKKGDTLASISRKTGITIDELKRLNNLRSSKLAIGQKLVLKEEEQTIKDDTTEVIAITDEKTQNIQNNSSPAAEQPATVVINKYHKIKRGETLSTIAKKYETTVASIKKLNNLKSSVIRPGKTIIVARIIREVPPVVINPTPIVPVTPKIYYSVKLGDTIESIASKFGISVSALKETNLISDNRIKIGQTLVIPQVANVNDVAKEDTSLSGFEKENSEPKLLASRIIENALNFINTPYRLGGLSRNGIDCSGLTKKAYEAAGISLPRTSNQQAKTGELVPVSAIKPGDLLFFGTKGRINHVGIYIGDNKFIHASRESGKVVVANLEEAYYQKHLICARTLINGEHAYWIEEEQN